MRKIYLRSILVYLILSFLSVFASCNQKADTQLYNSTTWPHEESNLNPDPKVIYGRLSNGFRYVLLKNKEPKDRVSMHLDVLAGSLYETDEQKGVAHFLEHMLFRGTTHFPPGELIKYFQNIGMEFGPDANAYTGFNETVYDVLLPKGDMKSIEEGLLVLQDFAQGGLLLPKEIDDERNVVLAEKRERDSTLYRTLIPVLKFELPGTQIFDRLPIGSEEIIRHADTKLLKEFYDTWYRPERMIIVMVGDFDPEKTIPIIEKKFAPLESRVPAINEPRMGSFDHNGTKAFYHFEKEDGNTSVSIEILRKITRQKDSKKNRIKQMKKNIADRIINYRLQLMLEKPGIPFTSAIIGSGIYLKEIEYADITAKCSPENWEKTLIEIEQTLRKALIYGFLTEELERVKKDYLSDLDTAVKKSDTRNSKRLKSRIINSINSDRVFLSPKQRRELLSPVISRLTLEDVHNAFKESWDADHRLILVTGNTDLTKSDKKPETQVLNSYHKSQSMQIEKPIDLKSVSFPYLPEPEALGTIIKRTDHKRLGIIQLDFKNGVRLNVKKTDFKDNEIKAIVAFGNGRSGEPKDHPGISDLSEAVINESGLGALNKDELERALTGKRTHIEFTISDGGFLFVGDTIPDEMELLFQLFYAYLLDPGYRKDAYTLVMERYRQRYRSMSHSIDGAIRLHVSRFLAGGDKRFGLPPYNDFKKLSLDDVIHFTKTEIKNAPLEISIVGDLNIKQTIKLASKYMGNLPDRNLIKTPSQMRVPYVPASKRLDVKIETEIQKGSIIIAYPTDDIWDIKRTRRLKVLGDILTEKMREQLREKMGATYSPYAYNIPSRVYSGYGIFLMTVNVDPKDTDVIINEVKRIVDEIARKGINKDELTRALKPTLTSIKDLLRKNDYWLQTVLNGSMQHPEQIEWSRSILDDHTAITADELSSLARKYLNNDKAAIAVMKPTRTQ